MEIDTSGHVKRFDLILHITLIFTRCYSRIPLFPTLTEDDRQFVIRLFPFFPFSLFPSYLQPNIDRSLCYWSVVTYKLHVLVASMSNH